MEGVSIIASQIHIKRGEEEIVLEFDPGSSAYANSKESETVFQWLASRGIPVYEVAELKRFPRYSGPLGAGREYYPIRLPDDPYDDFYRGYSIRGPY